MQSEPLHVAIVMDGNRRWARRRGLPEAAGHRRGAQALERLLPVLRTTSVRTLTVFGFAAANWQRTPREVAELMALITRSLIRCAPICAREGLRLEVIGRRDRFPDSLCQAIGRAERETHQGVRRLRLALDYSSREAIAAAARDACESVCIQGFAQRLGTEDVDLFIRTGGERRLSDFLLWECAFAELYFSDIMWPDFEPGVLSAAIAWFKDRQRRFGR